ncbi:hypothetical protein HDE_04263 [Halotydeus destructor]|nr:hypothetical protein HDE_04263 [Halotydeus destructor]
MDVDRNTCFKTKQEIEMVIARLPLTIKFVNFHSFLNERPEYSDVIRELAEKLPNFRNINPPPNLNFSKSYIDFVPSKQRSFLYTVERLEDARKLHGLIARFKYASTLTLRLYATFTEIWRPNMKLMFQSLCEFVAKNDLYIKLIIALTRKASEKDILLLSPFLGTIGRGEIVWLFLEDIVWSGALVDLLTHKVEHLSSVQLAVRSVEPLFQMRYLSIKTVRRLCVYNLTRLRTLTVFQFSQILSS